MVCECGSDMILEKNESVKVGFIWECIDCPYKQEYDPDDIILNGDYCWFREFGGI